MCGLSPGQSLHIPLQDGGGCGERLIHFFCFLTFLSRKHGCPQPLKRKSFSIWVWRIYPQRREMLNSERTYLVTSELTTSSSGPEAPATSAPVHPFVHFLQNLFAFPTGSKISLLEAELGKHSFLKNQQLWFSEFPT